MAIEMTKIKSCEAAHTAATSRKMCAVVHTKSALANLLVIHSRHTGEKRSSQTSVPLRNCLVPFPPQPAPHLVHQNPHVNAHCLNVACLSGACAILQLLQSAGGRNPAQHPSLQSAARP